MRARNRGIMLLVFILAAVFAVAGISSPVSADSCTAQLSYSITTSYNSNIGMIVPVSAGCSLIGSQLYAVGDSYDTSTNVELGTAKTMLTSNNGAIFSGQLVFNLSPLVLGHSVQVSVSIYGGDQVQYRSLITTTTETVQINPINQLQYGGCYPYNCNYNSNSCQTSGYDNTAQCAGYLYQDPVGCIEVVIPIYSPLGLLSYQYYTLHNLPASYPPIGSRIIVTGQLNQGFNAAPNGAACPGNYINVTSISQ
ncbi:MAG: hypothetical protein ABSF09_00915 [Candidatus Bathyarchaeia archaeon]